MTPAKQPGGQASRSPQESPPFRSKSACATSNSFAISTSDFCSRQTRTCNACQGWEGSSLNICGMPWSRHASPDFRRQGSYKPQRVLSRAATRTPRKVPSRTVKRTTALPVEAGACDLCGVAAQLPAATCGPVRAAASDVTSRLSLPAPAAPTAPSEQLLRARLEARPTQADRCSGALPMCPRSSWPTPPANPTRPGEAAATRAPPATLGRSAAPPARPGSLNVPVASRRMLLAWQPPPLPVAALLAMGRLAAAAGAAGMLSPPTWNASQPPALAA
eukprot:365296-Chlamydomonas_euryale.AAC.37